VTAIKKHLTDFIAVLVLILISFGVAGYILSNQESRPKLPFIEDKPFEIKIAFSDAQAVIPGQGQSVRVAGVKVGLIKQVSLKNGQAIVTVDIDKKYVKDLDLRADSTALLRPRTGLKDMFVELDPGSGPIKIKEGDTIPVSNTAPDVDPDEFLSALDSDTRSYLQLLINGAGKGLQGHGNDLREVFRRLGPTEKSLNEVTSAVALRRHELRRLIHNYGSLLDELSGKDTQLVRLVDESNAVFKSFANQSQNLTSTVSKLPGTLQQTSATLDKVQAFSPLLRDTLQSLRPAFRQLDTTNRQVLPAAIEETPIVRDKIRPFVRTARPVVRNLRPAATNLARATPDLTASFHQLNRLLDMAAFNPKGAEPVTGNETTDRARDEGYLYWAAWVTQNTVSLFSTSDATGPFRRALAGFNCTGIKDTLSSQPAAGSIIGLSNVLNTPGLCGGDSSELPGGGSPLPRAKGNKKQTTAAKSTGTPTALQGRPVTGSSGKP
jgi:phospholipid/cholesterol/gamma-HCH transport system substrate-binding protein